MSAGIATLAALLVVGATGPACISADDTREAPSPAAVESNANQTTSEEEMPRETQPTSAKKSKRKGAVLIDSVSWVIEVMSEVMDMAKGEEDGVDEAIDENHPMVMQMLLLCQANLKTELSYVRLVCDDLTPEQRKQIREAVNAKLKPLALQLSKRELEGGDVLGGIVVEDEKIEAEEPADPGFVIRQALLEALPQIVSKEQMARFREEADLRTATRKRVVIASLLAELDDQLCLSDDQKAQIEQCLSKNWRPGWERWLSAIPVGGRYLPTVPDQCVAPFLIPDQKTVWEGIAKIDFGFWMGPDEMPLNDENAEWWGFDKDPLWVPLGEDFMPVVPARRGVMILEEVEIDE